MRAPGHTMLPLMLDIADCGRGRLSWAGSGPRPAVTEWAVSALSRRSFFAVIDGHDARRSGRSLTPQQPLRLKRAG